MAEQAETQLVQNPEIRHGVGIPAACPRQGTQTLCASLQKCWQQMAESEPAKGTSPHRAAQGYKAGSQDS